MSARAQTCASPIPASVGDTPLTTVAGNHVNLTGICDVSQIGTDVIYNAAWLRFVAPASGQYIARTCGTVAFDSKIAVFGDCGNLASVIACNDDSAGCTIATGQPWASKVTFNATAGTAYYVAVGGFGPTTAGSGSLTIATAGTSNDGSSCAAAMTATDGLNAFNTAASAESVNLSGLCDAGVAGDEVLHRVRWFRYTATSTSETELSTCGLAAFDTRIAVFAECSTTSVIACNDDATGCAGYTSTLRFQAVQGTTYRIAVGGFDDSSAGAGQLLVTPNAPPPPTCGTATGSCCEAHAVPFCSDGACCTLVCNEDPYCCAIDGAWDAACANRAAILCTGCGAGTCTLPAGNALEGEPCGDDTNGGCNAVTPAFRAVHLGDRVSGTFWADADGRDTDWYELTVSSGTALELALHSRGPGQVFLVDASCPPAVIASSDANQAACPASISQCVLPGTYRIVVAMTVFSGFPCSDTDRTRYVLSVDGTPCNASPPANDECTGATPIAPSGGTVQFDTRLATNSAAQLDGGCDEGSGLGFVKDVWYAWTPAPGLARVSTCGTAGFDTRLAAHSACGGPSVACNDDGNGCAGFTSTMDLPADGTTTYLVRLGGYDSAGTGSISFSVLPTLANDECSTALPIGLGDTAFSTDTATDSDPPLDPVCDEGYGLTFRKDAWFRYDADCTGQLIVTTCGQASFDTRLAAYAGCGTGTAIACNDDAVGCDGLTSRMVLPVVAGQSYLLRVGGHSGSGSGTLRLVCGGSGGNGPANDVCQTAIPASAGPNAFDSSLAASDAPTSPSGGCVGAGFYGDVWYSFVPTQAGATTFGTCSAATFDTRIELWIGCPGAGGRVIACNDDACGNRSSVTANVNCGSTYLVRIGSYSPNGFGTGTLTIVPGTLPCSASCPADLTLDGAVDGADLGLLLGAWGAGAFGDLNGDGIVNGFDLGIMLGAWGPCVH